ncbi:MAG: hypothetical protein IPL97_01660 [Niastella sp.]|nr:hypothetical protein [Niastella sp.]
MLELIALYFLARYNGNTASRKGLKPGTWKIYTVVAWFSAEIIGFMLVINVLALKDLVSLMLIGLASGFGGFLLIKFILDKKPDMYDDDIENIGKL